MTAISSTDKVLTFSEGNHVLDDALSSLVSTVNGRVTTLENAGYVTGSGTNGQIAIFSGTGSVSGVTTLAATKGGTGLGAYTAGEMLYASNTTTLAALALGGANTVLLSDGSAPTWALQSSLTVGNISGGTATQLLVQDGVGSTTFVVAPSSADTFLKWDGSAFTWATASAAASGVTSIDVSGGSTGLTTSGGPVTSSGTVTLAGTLNGASGGTGVNNSGKTITLGGNLVTSGAFNTTLTVTADTSVTLPTSGTLATTASDITGNAATATTATNVAGGGANQIPYQSAADTTTFLAPSTGFLEYTGTTLQWASLDVSDVSGAAATASGLGQFAASSTTSAQLAGVISDETGSGALVFANSPTFTTPSLGVASATSLSLTNALAIAQGGTGATSATDARTNLGLGTAAVLDAGSPNGVAALDGSGTVPTSQLPAAVVGGVNYQGSWNANTNSPTLASSTGTKGYYYVVSTAGTTNLDGITDWQIGDWAIYNGSAWEKVDNTDSGIAANLSGGDANKLVYQSAADTTAFVDAPTTGSTFLEWSGTAFQWAALDVSDVSGAAATASDLTQFASTTAANLRTSVVTGTTGTGSLVFADSPTLISPVLGAASATSLALTGGPLDAQYGGTGVDNSGKTITLGGNFSTSGAFSTTLTVTGNTNVTLPTTGTLITASDDITGNAATATTATKATNVAGGGSNQIPYQSAADTTTFLAPSAGFLEYTGTTLQWASLEVSDVSGAAATASSLSQFASTTSAELAGVISDETGTGSLVFSNSPTFTTPSLGVATGTKLTLTSATAPALTATFDTALTTGVYSVAQIKVDSSSDVTGTLGAAADFVIRDSADTDHTIARVIGQRHTADNTGDLIFHTSNAGSMGEAGRFTNDNKLQLQSALEPAYGGTGKASYLQGDILYSSAGSTTLDTLSIGSSGQVLTVNGLGTLPQWSDASSLSVGSATSATTATNIASGAANQLVVQTGSGATSFVTAPTTGSTFLQWNGSAFAWASVSSGGQVDTVSGGTTGLTFTGTTDLTVGGTLNEANGGTGQTTYAKGDTLYSDAANSLAKLTVGSTGTIMRVSSSGIPEWSSSLDASFGGTGIISYSAGDIVYADTASSLTTVNIGSSGTVLTSSGSAPQWSAPSTLSVGTATKATNVAGGSANQIPYQSAADTTTFLAPATGFLEYTGTTLQWASLEVSDVSGAAATANKLDQFAATTSAELAGVISDETGTGSLVFATSPTLTTPSLSGAVGSSSDIYFRPNSSGSNTVQMTYDSAADLARLVAGTNSSAAGRLEAIAYTVASSERPGSIRLQEYDATNKYLWVDATGDFRIHTSSPTAAGDTNGTVVGTQSFTGAHFYSTDAIMDSAADDGTVAYLAVGDAVRLVNGKVLRSTAPNQKDVVGIFMGMTSGYKNSLTNETSTPAKLDENEQVIEPEVLVWQAAVASVGDNRDFSITQDSLRGFNVCNENGPIEAGDYLVSSSTPGYLMKQSDDLMRSSTVGKALETVTFDANGKASEVYGYVYCG